MREKAKILLRFERFLFRFRQEVIGLHIEILEAESVFPLVFGRYALMWGVLCADRFFS